MAVGFSLSLPLKAFLCLDCDVEGSKGRLFCHPVFEERKEVEIPLVGRIPFDRVFTDAMVQGRSVTEAAPEGPAARALRSIGEAVRSAL